MKKIHYTTEKTDLMGYADAASVTDDADLADEVVQAVVRTLSTDIMVTAGGVTMHLAAWQDPDHWEEDWAEALGFETFDEYVAGLVVEE